MDSGAVAMSSPVHRLPGIDSTHIGFGNGWSLGRGLAEPGRPIRFLVAEDRSAGGVRDQTGPD
jgi:hypothetical protein